MYSNIKGSIEVERWKFQHGKIDTLPADDPINRLLMARQKIVQEYMERQAAAAQKKAEEQQRKQLEKDLEKQLQDKMGKVLDDLLKDFK